MSLRKLIHSSYLRRMTHHSANEKSMEEIGRYLRKFCGGFVDLIKRPDGLAIITLNHPEKKNAVSGKMMVELKEIVEELESWTEGKGVIIKGSNHDFCSGGDLDFVKQINTPEEGFMMSKFMQNTLNKFQRLPMVSVAQIEGIGALGGGAELSVTCDFRVMTETCRGIGFVHGKMGIIPAWGGTNRLMEKVAYTKALDILLTGKIFSPQECLKISLIDEIIPTGPDSDEYTIEWLQNRTRFETPLIRGIKMSVSEARDNPRNYEAERRLFAPFWGSKGNREALERHKHQKKPNLMTP